MRTLALTLVLLAGCTANYTDGRYTCNSTSDCPPGLGCYGSLCSRAAPDASVDGGTLIDANCGAFGCATIRVTNAWLNGVSIPPFTLDGVSFPSLGYGQTSDDVRVPLTSASMLTLQIMDVGGPMDITVPTGAMSYTVIISAPADASMMPVVTILNNVFGGSSTRTQLHVASLIRGSGDFALAFATQTVPLHDFSSIATLNVDDTTTGPVSLTSGTDVIAAFDSAVASLPRVDGSGYYVVFTGRPDRPLAAADGLRMILSIPDNLHPRQSLPLAWFLNGSSTPVDVCQPVSARTFVHTVAMGALDGPFVPFETTTGRAFSLMIHGATACDLGGTVISAPITPGPTRFLVASMPDAMSPGQIRVVAAQEPSDPSDAVPLAIEGVGFANTLSSSASFGQWTTSSSTFVAYAGTSLIDPGMSATTQLTALPSMVAFSVASQTATWQSTFGGTTTPAVFAIPSVDEGGMAFLWEVAAPYGVAWSATRYTASSVP